MGVPHHILTVYNSLVRDTMSIYTRPPSVLPQYHDHTHSHTPSSVPINAGESHRLSIVSSTLYSYCATSLLVVVCRYRILCYCQPGLTLSTAVINYHSFPLCFRFRAICPSNWKLNAGAVAENAPLTAGS